MVADRKTKCIAVRKQNRMLNPEPKNHQNPRTDHAAIRTDAHARARCSGISAVQDADAAEYAAETSTLISTLPLPTLYTKPHTVAAPTLPSTARRFPSNHLVGKVKSLPCNKPKHLQEAPAAKYTSGTAVLMEASAAAAAAAAAFASTASVACVRVGFPLRTGNVRRWIGQRHNQAASAATELRDGPEGEDAGGRRRRRRSTPYDLPSAGTSLETAAVLYAAPTFSPLPVYESMCMRVCV